MIRQPAAAEITRHHDDPGDGRVEWLVRPSPDEVIAIVEPDSGWAARYAVLAADLRTALGARALDLDHVGSTAVPGLPAKDVIDIDLTVADPRAEDGYVPALDPLGYVLVVREPGWHEHRLLRLADPRVNLHVFGPGCPELVRHRIFRDWLTAHPADRDRYAQAKRAAADGDGTVLDYNARKEPLIRELYDRAFRAAGLL